MRLTTTNRPSKYVPPGRRHAASVLSSDRKPRFDSSQEHFPRLSARAAPGSDRPAADSQNEWLLKFLPVEQIFAEGGPEDATLIPPGMVTLPLAAEPAQQKPPSHLDYQRAARSMLARIQMERDREIGFIGAHSRWWGVPNVLSPMTLEDEPDLVCWDESEEDSSDEDCEDW